MLNPRSAWFAPATAAVLTLLVLGCNRADDDLSVQAVVDRVSQTQYETYQLAIENMGLGLFGGTAYDMGVRNRDGWEGPGSPGNQETRLYLRDEFTAMGLTATVQGSYMNVVGELTGTTTPEDIYIIGAHYDHLGGDEPGEDDRPGGDDNASGTAGVLEAARVLSQYRFESTIRFIGFNAEEDSLAGSRDYVQSHVIPAGENIAGMINMDMILRPGSDVEPDNLIDAEVEAQSKHPASVAWAQTFLDAAANYVPSLLVNDTIVDTESYSDNDPFLNEGYPAFLVIENSLPDFWDANAYYHTFEDASDRLANDPSNPTGVVYDYAFATDVTRAAVALLAQEAVVVSGPERR